jgi:hypothetical protein
VIGACAEQAASDDEERGESPPEVTSPKKVTSDDEPPKFEAKFDPDASPAKEAPPEQTPSAPCVDKDDPGSLENTAKGLSDTDDCDENFKTISGVMNGPVDVDFYKLTGKDKLFCSLDSDFESQTPGIELCVFARCRDASKDAVKGCSSGKLSKNELGMYGCCASNAAHALPDWDCKGSTDDDSADFYMRVKQLGAEKCLPYKLRYRF